MNLSPAVSSAPEASVTVGGVTCHTGSKAGAPDGAPADETADAARNPGRPGSTSTRTHSPSLPVTFSAAPCLACPITGLDSDAPSWTGAPPAALTLTPPDAACGPAEASLRGNFSFSVTPS